MTTLIILLPKCRHIDIVNIIVSDGTYSTTLIHHVYITDVEEASGLETPDNVQTVETK